jgi:hypothetical protein
VGRVDPHSFEDEGCADEREIDKGSENLADGVSQAVGRTWL